MDDKEKPFTKDSLSINKSRPALIEPVFTLSMGDVLGAGAKKYGTHNWKKCQDPNLYVDAMERHVAAIKKGETVDEEGLDHFACVGCNAMFLQWMHRICVSDTSIEHYRNLIRGERNGS